MPGSRLLEDFDNMSHANKATILEQMAKILAALQNCKLPPTVREFGGLQFGPSGDLISAPLSIMESGPFATYTDLVRATIESKLVKSDRNSTIQGWRANEIRARLDRFTKEGVDQIMAKLGIWPKVLVHADFSM